MPNFYILAGPNGAGKTTAAYTLLPEVLDVRNFVNADEIARGLSPFDVEVVAFEAGRIMLQRIDFLLRTGADFAIEMTLATRSYVQTIRRAKALGYTITLLFVYLQSSSLAVERVAKRVASGGHNIPEAVICRRYERALHNLVMLYTPICDYFIVLNNSGEQTLEVAAGGINEVTAIFDETCWQKITTDHGIAV
jgi:predicted ABC-type ATPase